MATEHGHVGLALRALQMLDEKASLGEHRHLLVRAETLLGEKLGLDCTGDPDGENADGTVAHYQHNGDTCPIHEWLVEADAPRDRAHEEWLRDHQ